MRYVVRLVPERERWMPALLAQIPRLEVVRDVNRNAIETFLLALAEVEDDAAVFLEDDALLTSDFCAKAEAVIAERAFRVVQLFSLRKVDVELGSRWMTAQTFSGNVCFYLPAGHAADLWAYYARFRHPLGHKDRGCDTLMKAWLAERRERYWLHVPSLAQHRTGKSAIDPRRSSRRLSVTFQP